MLSFGPTSSAAISALPDYLLNNLTGLFTGTVTYRAAAYSPYAQFVNTPGQRIVYAVALNIRAVR